MLGKVFICKLIRCEVDGPDLFCRLNISVPRRFTRNYIPLILNHCRFSYTTEYYVWTIVDYNLNSMPPLTQSILTFFSHIILS